MGTHAVIGAVLLSLGAAACAGSQAFVPAERAVGRAPGGAPAAEYVVAGAGAAEVADVQVFTDGVERARIGGRARTVVHVGLVVESSAAAPLALVRLRLDVDAGGRRLRGRLPAEVAGGLAVPGGAARTITARFTLPPAVRPEDVETLVVSWALRGDGVGYAQRTSFVPASPEAEPAYVIFVGGARSPRYRPAPRRWGPYPGAY